MSARRAAPPGPWRTSSCSSCRAPILWAITSKGNAEPINPQPSDVGNVMLTVVGGQLLAGVLGTNQAAGARDAGHRLYRSHFVDCPNANEHRRTKR